MPDVTDDVEPAPDWRNAVSEPTPNAIAAKIAQEFHGIGRFRGWTIEDANDLIRLIAAALRQRDERAAKIARDYAHDRWALYKGWETYKGNEQGRADPHVQGQSDGAEQVANLIEGAP